MLTRREFGRLAFTLPVAGAIGQASWLRGGAQERPESKIEGVQVGLIVPYSLGRDANDVDEILGAVTGVGINAIELQNGPVEAYAGAPEGPRRGRRGQPPTPEERAARQEAETALSKWRLSQSMDRFKRLRQKYDAAGVSIYAFKLALTAEMTDEEYDYVFDVGEALGANHLTMELPTDSALTRRIGEFAATRRMLVAYHTHEQGSLTAFDEALAQSKWNAINVDIGHYVAGTGESPIPLIRKHHSRFASIHLKDRKKNSGPNVPWGQGDTPIKQVLQLMKKERYAWPATIELEYPVPDGSTRVAEIGKCLDYCREALTVDT
jgi:sugar phosphate isomerase/epimerase